MIASLTAIGDWDKAIGVPLQTALQASVEICGKTGEKACRTALWFMAQSAQKMTAIAPKRRPVEANPEFRHLLRKDQYKAARMSGKDMAHYYTRRATKLMQPPKHKRFIYANKEDRIAVIANRGLGVRSWQWAIRATGHGANTTRRPIDGLIETFTIFGGPNSGPCASAGMRSGQFAGYGLRNKLGYVTAAMPRDWEQRVQTSAANRVMGEARNKLRREWASDMARLSGHGAVFAKKYFRTMARKEMTNAQIAAYFKAKFRCPLRAA